MHVGLPFNTANRNFFTGAATYAQATSQHGLMGLAGSKGFGGLGDFTPGTVLNADGSTTVTNADGSTVTVDINGNVIGTTAPVTSSSTAVATTSSTGGQSIFQQIVGSIPSLLQAEGAQNVISQQNAAAQALLAVNQQRAAQGLAPIASLSPITGAISSISPAMLLGIAAVIAFLAFRK